MKCSFTYCPGEYQEKRIAEVHIRNGEVVVITNIPAQVCSFCGDTLFHARVVKAIEALLERPQKAEQLAPVLRLPDLVA